MKILFLALCLVSLIGCRPQDATPTSPATSKPAVSKLTMNGILLKQGVLTGIGHTAVGTATTYDFLGKKYVVLDPFSSQNGPDLLVYLSRDINATDYIRLGKLQSTMGSQSYEVPGTTDIVRYGFVHIWCEKYTVVFARAELN